MNFNKISYFVDKEIPRKSSWGAKNGVFSKYTVMKIRRIHDIQYRFNFPNFDSNFESYRTAFLNSDLGKIYQAIPWSELVSFLKLTDNTKGPSSIFSPRGKIALMFLKHYACCSDKKLIEQLNANMDFQFFCDLHIPPNDRLYNYKIVSAVRCEIADHLNIEKMQDILMDCWLPFMNDLDSMTCDATCYESSIRYPTDVKLLWEAVEWSYAQMKYWSREAKVKLIRTKYTKWLKRYVSYSKMRKKRKKKRRALKRSLIWLLAKINNQLDYLEKEYSYLHFTFRYRRRRGTIKKLYEQQHEMFHEEKNRIKDRIVSIDKPYVRPIVRGKEKKPVEFGAKVHKLQIDGISIIEHLSFDAFNEGTRLKKTIFKTQHLTGKKVKLVGADAIYASNANRKFLTRNGIRTDFKLKGRPSKHRKQQEQIAKMITKERVSRLEGSFGTDKEHFLLKKNLARTKKTEILWIFFGIHTSNALKIGRRIVSQARLAA